jgi:hypothetical protein
VKGQISLVNGPREPYHVVFDSMGNSNRKTVLDKETMEKRDGHDRLSIHREHVYVKIRIKGRAKMRYEDE